MLTFIKTNYQTGDTIEVTCTEGTVTGQIEYVTSKYIVLRQSNGQICGIAAADVRSFRAQSPVPMVPIKGERTIVKTPAYEPEELNLTASHEADIAQQSVSEADRQERPQTLRDIIGEEKEADSADELTGADPVAEPKVVGHIDLASVDPNYGRRSYFRTDDQPNYESNYETNNAPAWQHNGYQRKPYVGARGRITYYNTTKRFGFIHDYNTDSDLYFYIQQIVDNDLFDHLHKGTKVVYSIGQNNQGAIATCIHLPHTVSDLYTMAEDSFDAHHLYIAKGLLEHILEVDPDNVDAKQLLGDVDSSLPTVESETQRGSLQPYNPCTLYTQAKKAYLAKNYDEAEENYLKALEADEKPESCVKDLLTLYVSLYKQTEIDDDKQQIRQKAEKFFEENKHLLTNNLTTKQFLALNYYLPIQDYDNFLKTVDELLNDPQVGGITSRRVFYMWQKGIALNKMGRTDEALAVCVEGLKIAPYNRQLANLRDAIEHPEHLLNHIAERNGTDATPHESGEAHSAEISSTTEPAHDEVASVAEQTEESHSDNEADIQSGDADNTIGDDADGDEGESPVSTQAEPWWKE